MTTTSYSFATRILPGAYDSHTANLTLWLGTLQPVKDTPARKIRAQGSAPTFAHACQRERELRLASHAKVVHRSAERGGGPPTRTLRAWGTAKVTTEALTDGSSRSSAGRMSVAPAAQPQRVPPRWGRG